MRREVVRIAGALRERDAGVGSFPRCARWRVEIDVDAVAIVEVRADAVVGRELREGARAAGPLILVISLICKSVVIVGV